MLALLVALIHRSAWKGLSAKLNFRFTESKKIAWTEIGHSADGPPRPRGYAATSVSRGAGLALAPRKEGRSTLLEDGHSIYR